MKSTNAASSPLIFLLSFDKLPKTDASGDDIDYAGSDIKEIDIERKTILDISDNTAIRVASTRDELNLGVYTILGELSSNNIETIYGTHTNTIASELSLNDIVSENIVFWASKSAKVCKPPKELSVRTMSFVMSL